ncbi:DnaJ domain containing protein [Parasponia andersonii]|uniref:DnaJ domain containing protein n=1 Tax=Parasponia andersonii TaxID=3476 RepID=A0A2P5C1R2_PARAD|nr:DnaJ domain containing protein [Parasponia andersonii]
MEYQATSLAFSEKLSNGHGLAGNSIYDGVVGPPPSSKFSVPNFSSRVEDYREIFGGGSKAASRGSSIPFLEVPELNEPKITVDFRSSKLDYSKIFGGFGDSNFAVPYQEFSSEPNKKKKSEQPRTPAQRFSPPEDAERSSCIEWNCVMTEEASQPVKKFNMSYNKINNGNVNGTSGTNGTTHIAQLHAVRGYAHLIGEDDKPVFSEVNDTFPKNNVSEGIMEGDHFTRTTMDVRAGETGKQASGCGDEFQNNSKWFRSHLMDKLFDKDEVGKGTLHAKLGPSSSLPGKFNLDKAEGIFGTDTTEESTGVYSPPFFDEEIDMNSVAATSAAALMKAIEEAQARIKMAKELMERKKAGIQNREKLRFADGVNPEERKENKIACKVNGSNKKKIRELCAEVDIPFKGSSKLSKDVDGETPWKEVSSQGDHRQEEAEISEEALDYFYEVEDTDEHWSTTTEVDIALPVSAVTRNQNATGPGQVTGDFEVQEFVSSAKEATGETLCNDLKSSQVDCRQEKAEPVEAAEQFYEIENSDKNWATSLEFDDVNLVQSVNEEEWKDKKIAQELFEKPRQCVEGLKPVEEEDYPEKIRNGISGASDFGMGGAKSTLDVEVFDLEKIDEKQRVAIRNRENEKIAQAFCESDKCEKKPVEFLEPRKDDNRLGIWGLEDATHMKRQSTSWELVENDRQGEEASEPEEHEKEQKDACGADDTEQRFVNGASGEKIVKETLNEPHLGEKIAKILAHDGETEGKEKILEGNTSQKEEYESRQEETCQRVESGRTETEIDQSLGDEEKMKTVQEEQGNQNNNLGAADNLCKQDESDDLSENQKPTIHAKNYETVEVLEEVPACEESGSITEVSDAFLESNESGNEFELGKEKYDMEDRDVLETDGFPQGLDLTEIMKPMEDKRVDTFLDKNDTDDQHVEQLASEMENIKDYKESEVSVSLDNDESNTKCCDEKRWVDNGVDMKASQLSDTSEGEEENVGLNEVPRTSSSTEKDQEYQEETPISKSVEQNEMSHQETLPSQSVETNEENHKPTVTVEESETNDSLQKEVELEKDHVRKIDEAKEREREKEKEKIAVERAIREARKRAFAEARERAAAERAAAARKRVTSESWESVGRTSSESNNKPVAEKVSKEAKLKAERAAVERATAEARERALEKAMSGKAASEARKQNPQHKGSFSSSTSRYPNSSNHGVPNNTERFDGVNGESVQRCKARLERHQRITERAEKALAEKNRRDLLAQKEQAERHRLAETLDIEVKRWSSGKEGNLRALLSTLQYILGPDSGWQPIPLTDLLTAAAVKKTYRKATLFVHPDKLQQRGANIQQKYTCEKVFDLLKEAWNRFNVEER